MNGADRDVVTRQQSCQGTRIGGVALLRGHVGLWRNQIGMTGDGTNCMAAVGKFRNDPGTDISGRSDDGNLHDNHTSFDRR